MNNGKIHDFRRLRRKPGLAGSQSAVQTPPEGLTAAEVSKRVATGQVNRFVKAPTRSISEIIAANIFTLFNFINLALALLVVLVAWRDPDIFRNMLFMGVVLSNMLIGIIQEIRAKMTIDRLSLLTETKARVMRDGRQISIPTDHLVIGDLMLLASGNQVTVDGHLVDGEGFEVDESLLTGESGAIRKQAGEPVLSGCFVVAGEGWVQVDKVGADTFAVSLAREAKKEKKSRSGLMVALTRIIRLLSVMIVPVGLLLFFSKYLRDPAGLESIVLNTVAALIGMIPEGLILLTSISFAVSVVNMGKVRALVQSLPCIETLARVDILCLDKTGTITDGRMDVQSLLVLPGAIATTGEAALALAAHALAALGEALPGGNATNQAVQRYFTDRPGWEKQQTVPFSSLRKWSGAEFSGHGTWVIGAPEFVLQQGYEAIRPVVEQQAALGFRVVLLAHSATPFGADGSLTAEPQPQALVLVGDHVREDAHETFDYFRKQGVGIKIISGDNALTVASVARRAGIEGCDETIDMSKLSPDADLEEIADGHTVFGRVTPHQKRELLQALKRRGHTVAMTGDGVNDVLALRDADFSVAMAGGSEAARAIADMVLLDNNLSAMIQAVYEGRRVINNIERVATLFLVKTIYSALLAVLFILLPHPYPFYPIQLSMIGVFTIGVPAFFLAFKPNRERVQGSFLQIVLAQSLPAGLTVVLLVLGVNLLGPMLHLDFAEISTLCLLAAVGTGLGVLAQVSRPYDVPKILLLAVMCALCLLQVLFLADFYFLEPVVSHLAVFYLPILALIWPVQKLLRLLLDHEIFWWNRHSQGTKPL